MNPCDDLLIQLGGYVGLRAFEILQIHPGHVKRIADGDHYRLRVPEGKDTTGSSGKPRDAYLPPDIESDIHRYQTYGDIVLSDSLVDLIRPNPEWQNSTVSSVLAYSLKKPA